MFGRVPQGTTFQKQYKCFSMIMAPRKFSYDVENGGKILLPPSTLGILANFNVVYPLLFQIANEKENISTHCGVLEFVAEEGRVYLPRWMMDQLKIDEGDIIKVKNVAIPVGKFVKLQPQSEKFLSISNPRAVLEKTFREFACLTIGDVITINYNSTTYSLKIMETKPSNAISIIEADLEVDFEAPPGYVEPTRKAPEPVETPMEEDPVEEVPAFVPFSGGGQSLRGKTVENASRSPSSTSLNQFSKSPSPSPRAPSPFGSVGKSPSPRAPFSFGTFAAPNAQPVALPAGKLVFGKVSSEPVTPSSSSSSLTSSLNTGKPGTIGRSQGQTLAAQTSSGSTFQAFSGAGHSLKNK